MGDLHGKRLRMTQAQRGSPDPSYTRLYEAGAAFVVGSLEMPEALAAVFIRERWAEIVGPEPEKAPDPDPQPVQTILHTGGGWYQILRGDEVIDRVKGRRAAESYDAGPA